MRFLPGGTLEFPLFETSPVARMHMLVTTGTGEGNSNTNRPPLCGVPWPRYLPELYLGQFGPSQTPVVSRLGFSSSDRRGGVQRLEIPIEEELLHACGVMRLGNLFHRLAPLGQETLITPQPGPHLM